MARTRKVELPGTGHPQPEPAGPPAPAASAGRWLTQLILPLVAGGTLVAGVLVLGRHARRDLAARGHYQVAFADIDCPAPPGLSRGEFLGQVQYLADLPDQLDSLDPGLGER